MNGQAPDLFTALRDGVIEFRARVEGSSGDHRADLVQIAGTDGIAMTVIEFVLDALADILSWLYDALDDIEAFVLQVDAAVAVLQVIGVGLQSTGEALDQDWPEGFEAAGQVADAIGDLGTTLASISDIELPDLIPDPAALNSIRDHTRALLGARVDPDADPPVGALDQLRQDLGIQP